MGIVNRRNAVIGWIVVKVGKRAAKKKAQGRGARRRPSHERRGRGRDRSVRRSSRVEAKKLKKKHRH